MKNVLLLALMFTLSSCDFTSSTKAPVDGVWYTVENHIFAGTEENLDKATLYQAQNDMAAIQIMIDNGLVGVTKNNVPVYVVENGILEVKIRPKGQTDEFWVVREAISPTPIK